MGGILFYLGLPLIFAAELSLTSYGCPHLALQIFCVSLVCEKMIFLQRIWALLFAMMAVFIHGMPVVLMMTSICACWLIWYLIQPFFANNTITNSIVAIVFVVGLLLSGGGFTWTPQFLIANILLIPVMVSLWCRV